MLHAVARRSQQVAALERAVDDRRLLCGRGGPRRVPATRPIGRGPASCDAARRASRGCTGRSRPHVAASSRGAGARCGRGARLHAGTAPLALVGGVLLVAAVAGRAPAGRLGGLRHLRAGAVHRLRHHAPRRLVAADRAAADPDGPRQHLPADRRQLHAVQPAAARTARDRVVLLCRGLERRRARHRLPAVRARTRRGGSTRRSTSRSAGRRCSSPATSRSYRGHRRWSCCSRSAGCSTRSAAWSTACAGPTRSRSWFGFHEVFHTFTVLRVRRALRRASRSRPTRCAEPPVAVDQRGQPRVGLVGRHRRQPQDDRVRHHAGSARISSQPAAHQHQRWLAVLAQVAGEPPPERHQPVAAHARPRRRAARARGSRPTTSWREDAPPPRTYGAPPSVEPAACRPGRRGRCRRPGTSAAPSRQSVSRASQRVLGSPRTPGRPSRRCPGRARGEPGQGRVVAVLVEVVEVDASAARTSLSAQSRDLPDPEGPASSDRAWAPRTGHALRCRSGARPSWSPGTRVIRSRPGLGGPVRLGAGRAAPA